MHHYVLGLYLEMALCQIFGPSSGLHAHLLFYPPFLMSLDAQAS
jgi:hypothetical protein